MRLPNFFLVGAPKAGTTTLFERIGEHPDAFISPRKEPHYVTAVHDGWPTWGVRTLEAYRALFADAGDAKAVGEGSTWYLYSPSAAAAIRALVPEAKILIALRNPIDRAFSAWGYNVEKGWETERTFEAALAREDERTAEPGFWDRHYVRAGMYAAQVERYLDAFGASQIKVVLFDDLRADGASVIRDIYDFLDLPPFDPPPSPVQNRTRYPRSARFAQLIRSGSVRRAARWVPAPIRGRLSQAIAEANTAPKPEVDGETRARLERIFRPDVKRLESLIGRPLEARWLGGPT